MDGERSYDMQGIEPESIVCKASVLPNVISGPKGYLTFTKGEFS